jgi:hypothetical protein
MLDDDEFDHEDGFLDKDLIDEDGDEDSMEMEDDD